MSWAAVQESMKARKAFTASALGVLWMLAGAVLLPRPGSKIFPSLLIADGALTVGTGEGLISTVISAVKRKSPPGQEPALKEV